MPSIASPVFDIKNVNKIAKRDLNTSNHSYANWTVMYYMCCDPDSSLSAEPILQNLSKIGSIDNMNLVVLYDGELHKDSNIYYIDDSGRKVSLNHIFGWPDEVDMSRSTTFELFCTNIMKYFPSEHYAFITYANGGTGWQKYPLDDKDGRGYLTIPEFAESLKKITQDGENRLDVLQTSCCMSNIELAYEFAPYVNYLITTQEHISNENCVRRAYQAVWDLKNDTSMTPESFSKKAAIRHDPHTFQYFKSYGYKLCALTTIFNKLPFSQLHTVQMHSSVSIVNLTRVDSLVKEVQAFTQTLLLHLENKEIINAIKEARSKTREYGEAFSRYPVPYVIYARLPIEILSYNCRIDLYNFVEILKRKVSSSMIKKDWNSVMEDINDTVLLIKKVESDPPHGLNIYFPKNHLGYNKNLVYGKKIPCPYERLKFSKDTAWDEFLKGYLGLN